MWEYCGKKIKNLQDLPGSDKLFGFVYKITSPSGKFYIGKKNFYTSRKKPIPKKLQSTDKRRKTYTIITKESDWLTYNSSCDSLKNDILSLGESKFKKEIIKLCNTQKELSYWEMAAQVITEVLLKESYNDNIGGVYYRKDFLN